LRPRCGLDADLALGFGALTGALAAAIVSLPTAAAQLYFAIDPAFAEMVRILFEMFRYRKDVDGDMIGPDGADGFRNIRYIFENDISGVEFMLIIYALLAVTLIGFMLLERSRLGVTSA
jgi:branched-chain amino acid transport system permease protein